MLPDPTRHAGHPGTIEDRLADFLIAVGDALNHATQADTAPLLCLAIWYKDISAHAKVV